MFSQSVQRLLQEMTRLILLVLLLVAVAGLPRGARLLDPFAC